MSDLVERLRRAAKETTWPAPQHEKDTLYALAADEIERLRARLAEAERAKGEPIAWMVGNDPMTAAVYNKGEKEKAFDAARRWKTSITGLQVVAGAPTFAAPQPPEQPQMPRTGFVHVLKCWPEFFAEVISGRKTFEIRQEDDRIFNVGDSLQLREYDPKADSYSGRTWSTTITYKTDWMQKDGVVVLGLASPEQPQGASDQETPVVGYMVCSDDVQHAALYPLSKREQAFDAARRWQCSITALACHPSGPSVAVPHGTQITPEGKDE